MKLKVHDFPPLKVSDLMQEAMQLARPLAEARVNGKQVFQVRCLVQDNFGGSYGTQVLTMKPHNYSSAGNYAV